MNIVWGQISATWGREPLTRTVVASSVTLRGLDAGGSASDLSGGIWRARLQARQAVDHRLWARHVRYLVRFLKVPSLADEAERLGIPAGLTAARKMLARTDAPDNAAFSRARSAPSRSLPNPDCAKDTRLRSYGRDATVRRAPAARREWAYRPADTRPRTLCAHQSRSPAARPSGPA